jgi:enterochelin esterase-like enzyme
MISSTTNYIKSEKITIQEFLIPSKYLKREVKIQIVLPPNFSIKNEYKILLMNDGQDIEQLKLENTLNELYGSNVFEPIIVVGINANKDRLKEYGTASLLDYKGRGNKAEAHKNFVIYELLRFLNQNYSVSKQGNFYCGFSLGGLSALDIGYAFPNIFAKVGVFSGSFWWRSKSVKNPSFNEKTDRIMHNIIRKGNFNANQKFWFECGTADEKVDRNNNGIIDSIDDTKDLIYELLKKGYTENDITYLEINGGQHNFGTWSVAFPVFLKWLVEKS